MCLLHVSLELETEHAGSFIQANWPQRVVTPFCWCCAFSPPESLFLENTPGGESSLAYQSSLCPFQLCDLRKVTELLWASESGKPAPTRLLYWAVMEIKMNKLCENASCMANAVDISEDIWSPSKGGGENRSLSSRFTKESSPAIWLRSSVWECDHGRRSLSQPAKAGKSARFHSFTIPTHAHPSALI